MKVGTALAAALLALASPVCTMAQQQTHKTSEPVWLRGPTSDEIGLTWRALALDQGVTGKVSLRCEVDLQGLLQDCAILSESPSGAGLGAAALSLTQKFLFQPATRDGQPVIAPTTIPLEFTGPGARTSAPTPSEHLLGSRSPGRNRATLGVNVHWSKAPSSAEVAAAYPKRAAADTRFGHVVLACQFSRGGDLKDCYPEMEVPRKQGFVQAAESLVPLFHLDPGSAPGTNLSDVHVELAVHFTPANASAARLIDHPDWIHATPPDHSLFPEKAAQAGLATGRVVLDCIADSQGKMTQCKVVSEDPAGMGFAAAALETAKVMTLNPWLSAGEPADGAHVTFAVRLNNPKDEPAQGGGPAG